MSRKQKPNVVLVITDDQGYADLGVTGNPWIKTDAIDEFASTAVRVNDFHVSPLCTPTRGAIMSGRRPVRNGAWATCWGRSILKRHELTMPEIFRDSGYATGMFGKWHLGDNYPYRPEDRGFDRVVCHRGGGVGQTPDHWGNNYFDDTYFSDSVPTQYQGYCTDIWFNEALAFIEEHRNEPFFAYISTNAPHSPYLVPDAYADLYRGNPDIPSPEFYGMITSIDENFARLRAQLARLELENDTILLFMTDNGSSGGCTMDRSGMLLGGYNAGLRGKKGSYYDGGHRVPLFLRWPNGNLHDRNIEEMLLHIDLLPTFVELCGLNLPREAEFDGISAAPILRGETTDHTEDRVTFLQYRQYTEPPEKWTNCVMTRRYRLVGGAELYDIKQDPGQRVDVAQQHPDVVSRLREAHEIWWDRIEGEIYRYAHLLVGDDRENPTRLCAMDVAGDVAWNQVSIAEAQRATGRWMVEFERPGRYRFELRRWPEELDLAIDACISPDALRSLAPYHVPTECRRIAANQARLSVYGREEALAVDSSRPFAAFERVIDETGATELEAWFDQPDAEPMGAYYVTAVRLDR